MYPMNPNANSTMKIWNFDDRVLYHPDIVKKNFKLWRRSILNEISYSIVTISLHSVSIQSLSYSSIIPPYDLLNRNERNISRDFNLTNPEKRVMRLNGSSVHRFNCYLDWSYIKMRETNTVPIGDFDSIGFLYPFFK